MPDVKAIGFIGLGVMGEPICRNLARKSGGRVIAFEALPDNVVLLRENVALNHLENHVRVVRGFGHEEIHDAEEFELLKGFLRELGIGK